MKPQAIRPVAFPWLRTDGYTFSLGLQESGSAWLSGHSASAFNPDSRKVEVVGDMHEQARVAYAKIAAILEAAGLDFADVVHVRENVRLDALNRYEGADRARRDVLGAHEPVIVTIGVDRLLREDALIEIEVSAEAGGGGELLANGLRATRHGVVHLPLLVPVDRGGEVVAAGDLIGQYRSCLERAGELLTEAGLGLKHITRVVDFTSGARHEYFQAMAETRRRLFDTDFPAVASIVMSSPPHPGALVVLEIVASRHQPQAINAGWRDHDTSGCSDAVRAGRMLFLSGTNALAADAKQTVYAHDVVNQARSNYERMGSVLAAAGATAEHLIETVEYVCPAGLDGYRGVGSVRRELLVEPWPASTGIVCAALSPSESLLEVVPTALLPE